MKNLRRMLACGLLLSQLFCGQAWAAEVHTPCYRNSVDTENSDFDKGEWKYRFTADSGQETVLTEGEKHTFLIINGGLSAEHIIIENGRAFMELGALCDALGLQREEVKDMALSGKTICVENEIYVPVRAFATQLGATVTYGMQEVMPMGNPCINLDNRAQKIGAVNTVVNRNGRLCGYNTDFYGFRYLLQKNGIDVAGKKALVLGKGGASKAVIAVLEELGASEIITVYYKEYPETVTYAECYKNHADAKIIVNTTPVGMYPNSDDCPIDLDRFTALEGVADVVYNPLRTQLVLEAEKRGIRAAGGLEMLVAQAKYAVEIFLDTHLEDARIAEINTPLLKERSNLVLVGMSGGGKSTIGKRAAEKLSKGFVDTDDLIIERIKMPIAEFFAKEGEPAFREIETKVIHEVSSQNNLVIATGGGIIKNPLNVEYLKRNGRLIWLKRDADLLQTGNGRPLAPDQAAAQKLYHERLPLYTAAAEAIAENNGTFEEGLSAVLRCYEALLK